MKRIVSLIMVLTMSLSLCSCVNHKTDDTKSTSPATSAPAATPTPETTQKPTPTSAPIPTLQSV